LLVDKKIYKDMGKIAKENKDIAFNALELIRRSTMKMDDYRKDYNSIAKPSDGLYMLISGETQIIN
jgi:hypothetical protein